VSKLNQYQLPLASASGMGVERKVALADEKKGKFINASAQLG
jgi:hypothetical protein